MNRNNEGNLTEKAPSAKNGKPAGLPDKFWDENSGKINLEALLEDYNSMASRDENLIESHNRRMPESYDKYEVKFPHPLLDRDDEIFRRFFENGFTNEQAQLVYDLANERVIPVLDSLASDYEAERQLEKLKRFFGSEEKFNELNEESLRKMMEDPRYWRDKDASYIARITKGFEKLYPEK